MQQDNLGQSVSLWMETVTTPPQSTLAEDTHADVCIVGAGIAGITTAYLLAEHGKSVVVLDDGAIGGGETQRTTAHLSNALDDRYFEIERLHGSDGAKLAASSHTAAIDPSSPSLARNRSPVISSGWTPSDFEFFRCSHGDTHHPLIRGVPMGKPPFVGGTETGTTIAPVEILIGSKSLPDNDFLPDSLDAVLETMIPRGKGRAIAFPVQRLRIAVVEESRRT